MGAERERGKKKQSRERENKGERHLSSLEVSIRSGGQGLADVAAGGHLE